MPGDTIKSVLNGHRQRLMSLPGVTGVGQGECEHKPCIKIYVARKTGALLKQLPATLDGYPVSIEESGEFRALST
ncbi:MAG: hypothetical protein Q7R57_08100 [Dehalococcoidales bacterium]|nr:hypothetical protein [Dehalococcoidales bacterium]